MVSHHPTVPQSTMAELLLAIQRGLESLTVTSHSAVLTSMHAEALRAVIQRPTLEQRELALSQAWVASATATEAFQVANVALAAQKTQEMYRLVRLAISASLPD